MYDREGVASLGLLVEMGWHHCPGPPESFSPTSPVAPSGAHLSACGSLSILVMVVVYCASERERTKVQKIAAPFILGEMSPENDAGEGGSVGQRTAGCRTAPDSAESPFSFPNGKGALLVYKVSGSVS